MSIDAAVDKLSMVSIDPEGVVALDKDGEEDVVLF
jgi:hypothetical protein